MATRLNPYLTFSGGEARTAMERYQQVFGGDLAVSTFGEYGMTDPGLADQVMHAQLETPDGFLLMGSDVAPGAEHVVGTNVTVSLSGDDVELLHRWWDALADGGTVATPLEVQMWGDEFGQVTDRFGVQWLVNIAVPHGVVTSSAPGA